jgi:hypothetical protein
LRKWWPVGAVLRQRVAAGGGKRGGGTTELVGGPVPGEKKEGISGIPKPTLARAVVLRGGELRGGCRSGAAAMASGGARRSGGRRWRLRGWLWSSGVLCGPLYRRPRRWRRGCGGGGLTDSAAGFNGGGGGRLGAVRHWHGVNGGGGVVGKASAGDATPRATGGGGTVPRSPALCVRRATVRAARWDVMRRAGGDRVQAALCGRQRR